MALQALRQRMSHGRSAPAPVLNLQPDTLDAEDLAPALAGHSGIPEAADSLAYDVDQGLLAVRSTLLAFRLGICTITSTMRPGRART